MNLKRIKAMNNVPANLNRNVFCFFAVILLARCMETKKYGIQDEEFQAYLNAKTISDMQKFIETYPESKYRERCEEEIEEITLYENTCGNPDETDFKSYLTSYPQGKYNSKVRYKWEEYLWQNIKQDRYNIKGYYDYENEFPEGKHIHEVRDVIDFASAEKEGTRESFERYLEVHPEGNYSNSARNILYIQKMVGTPVTEYVQRLILTTAMIKASKAPREVDAMLMLKNAAGTDTGKKGDYFWTEVSNPEFDTIFGSKPDPVIIKGTGGTKFARVNLSEKTVAFYEGAIFDYNDQKLGEIRYTYNNGEWRVSDFWRKEGFKFESEKEEEKFNIIE